MVHCVSFEGTDCGRRELGRDSRSRQEAPVVPDGKPVVSEGKPVVSEGKPVVSEGKPVVSERKPVVSEGKPVVTEGKPVVSEGKPGIVEGNRASPKAKPGAWRATARSLRVRGAQSGLGPVDASRAHGRRDKSSTGVPAAHSRAEP